ncbi:hypothetical protein evm_014982, partial [Chilo suppressalis]
HADGSVKFWDASAGTLQILYKLKCSKVFERRASGSGTPGAPGASGAAWEEEGPLGVQALALCAESRRLAVALPHGHCVLFKFRKTDTHAETHVLEIPVISESLEEETSPDVDGGRSMSFSRGGDATEAESRRSGVWTGGGGAGAGTGGGGGGLRVRGAGGSGGARRAAGFQPALVAPAGRAPHPNHSASPISSSSGLYVSPSDARRGGQRGRARAAGFSPAARWRWQGGPAPIPSQRSPCSFFRGL